MTSMLEPTKVTEQAIKDSQAELAGLQEQIAEQDGKVRRLAADGNDSAADVAQVKRDALRRKAERLTIRLEGLHERLAVETLESKRKLVAQLGQENAAACRAADEATAEALALMRTRLVPIVRRIQAAKAQALDSGQRAVRVANRNGLPPPLQIGEVGADVELYQLACAILNAVRGDRSVALDAQYQVLPDQDQAA
jgi:hypothetical protein